MDDIGLMQELIEDALHLAHDQGQVEESEYREALFFVQNDFSFDIYWTNEELIHCLSSGKRMDADQAGRVTDTEMKIYLLNRRMQMGKK